ncbi:hypothetical protein Hanom_Chr16g01443941 [Helianthus anomalus]
MTRLRRPGKEKDVDPPSKPDATKKRKTTIDQVHVLIPYSRNVFVSSCFRNGRS